MTPTVLEAINQQVSNEFSASFSYLSMAGLVRAPQVHGRRRLAARCRARKSTRTDEAVQLSCWRATTRCTLLGIEAPRASSRRSSRSSSSALAQEQGVSGQIDALYELAFREKVFAAMAELQWFITEQVEEEKTVREIVAKFQMVSHDPASMLDLDRELGAATRRRSRGARQKS